MLIEIDGYFNKALLKSEVSYSLEEIERMYINLKNQFVKIDELSKTLCKQFNMIEINKTNEIKVDIVIDTDTDRIYKPRY